MSSKNRFVFALFTSLVIFVALISFTGLHPLTFDNLKIILLLTPLLLIISICSVPLGAGTFSLLPMLLLAMLLALGVETVVWPAFIYAWLYGILRYYFAEQMAVSRPTDPYDLWALTPMNATMHATATLMAGLVYQASGLMPPLRQVDESHILPLLAMAVTYVTVNQFIMAVYFRLISAQAFQDYFRLYWRIFLYEFPPLAFAPLVALIYTRLGWGHFLFFAMALVFGSGLAHYLSRTQKRLEQRIQELDSLQAVGQTLSSSLDLEQILTAVHTQVSHIMPAVNFYIALLDADRQMIHFPFWMQHGKRTDHRSRPMNNGLTEYIVRTRRPLLIPNQFSLTLHKMGIDQIGPPAACWLGVPMLAGNETFGIIAVQSLDQPNVYDHANQEILQTIAAQAAIAIQNAHLYSRTDQALIQRVQQLDSVLRTTQDGILLLDHQSCVVTANPSFENFMGLSILEAVGHSIIEWPSTEKPLLNQLGYTPIGWQEACQALLHGDGRRRSQHLTITNGSMTYDLERMVAPVLSAKDSHAGWLLVFRDITEEIALSQLREDMTHMLVHDLRAPLTMMVNGFEVSRDQLQMQQNQEVLRFLSYAEKNCQRLLQLIDDLLDISHFENGQVPLHYEQMPVRLFIQDVLNHFVQMAAEIPITFEIDVPPNLPHLRVDSNYINRVLHNLIDNAVKFTPDNGHIRVWARTWPPESDEPFSKVIIGISDNGAGIPPKLHHLLFQKFQQGITQGGRRHGTGLGLSYCKLVVEAHGGEIWVQSDGIPGHGTTFSMTLPVWLSS